MTDLGPRGAALWTALGQPSTETAAGVLAMEACRTADRLEQLNDVVAGKGVLQLMHFRSLFDLDDDDHRVFELHVDKLLSETRQQAAGLKALLESPLLKKAEAKGTTGVDDVAARRAARRAAAAGS